MPPTVTEIAIKNFRGNILDRQFPVQFDPDTGKYSYNYANVTPNIAPKLKNLKYYRKSSKNLKELEDDLAAFLKKEGPAAPPVKGEITKAAEGEVEKLKKAETIYKNLEAKAATEPLTPNEQALGKEVVKETIVLLRGKKAEYAKQEQEKLKNAYNRKVQAGEAVTTNASGRIQMNASNQAKYDSFEQIIAAFDKLQELEAKVKRGEKLTAEEEAEKDLRARTIDTFKIPEELIPKASNATNINEKGEYNNARAIMTQLEYKTNLTTEEKAKKAKAINIITKYTAKHPEALAAQVEKKASTNKGVRTKMYKNALKKLNNLSKKNKPLSTENEASRTSLQAQVDMYRRMYPNINAPNEMAPLQVEGAKNIFAEPNVLDATPGAATERELSNEAFQARRGKAQEILDYFARPNAPAMTPELEELRRKAQEIIDAFAVVTRANASAANKKTANTTIRKSNFLNRARTLKVPTGGRRLRKTKRSKRKTHRSRQ